jgi:Spy/CpxP family protein refolding chaperone
MNCTRYAPLRPFVFASAAALCLSLLGCNSQQPQQTQSLTAEEQMKMEQDRQKTMEQVKQLTSGYDKAMKAVPPSTGYDPKKALHQKQ